ncbi:MAG: PAS domain-containing protein [Campylobacterales bacterium]|nr:PAS domain-containing protein [Campylobacterales bacterium]
MHHVFEEIISSQLFEHGSIAVFLWRNAPGWPVAAASSNLKALLGYDPSVFTSATINYADQIHPEDVVQVFEEVRRASEELTCNAFTHEPYRFRHAQGHYLWLKDATTIIRDASGAITHYVGYLHDISAEIAMQQESRFLKERLDLAMQATMDGLWDWNVQSGEVYFSPQWKAMLGFADHELENTLET